MGVMNVYNASAGSGKTYTLVREYLKIILSDNNQDSYRNILAITFTNKAAAQMKGRILSTLEDFSILENASKNPMFDEISKELQINKQILSQRSAVLLRNILHDYSSLSISTIDSFTTRLVRSFAAELKLPVGFEIVLDNKDILDSAIDMLLLRAGKDKDLSDLLLGYIIQNIDQQSSWDVAALLTQAADISSKEKSIDALKILSDKSISDFVLLRKKLLKYKKDIEQEFFIIGERACEILNTQLEGGALLNNGKNGITSLFRNAYNLNIEKINIEAVAVYKFCEGNCYAGKLTQSQQDLVDNVYSELLDLAMSLIELVTTKRDNYMFCASMLAPLDKMSVITEIDAQVKSIKEQDSVMLLYEFNKIISEHIRQEPVPFIYEKIGERYKHYFIDEFQDTSTLQWENLQNLIYNQLSSDGTALIVGDAKQAIYRWRGGDSEQFIELCDDSTKTHFDKKVQNLDTNYRSSTTVVEFTNDFFTTIAAFALDEHYSKEYIKGNAQKANKKTSGFVSIQDIKGEKVADREKPTLNSIIKEIQRITTQDGFQLKDIAILCNKNTQGALIAQHLKNEGIEVVSADSLFVNSSEYVRFVVAMLRSSVAIYNGEPRATILNFIATHGQYLSDVEDTSQYMSEMIKVSYLEFIDQLQSVNQSFSNAKYLSLPLYESVEYIIETFSLWGQGADEYLIYFMDLLAEYIKYGSGSASGFLEHWDLKKANASIPSAEGMDAVSIMTIHKSKGLEFPVVIVPFCDWNIKKDEEVWTIAPKEEIFEDIDIAYLSISKIRDCGMEQIYGDYHSKIIFDNINKLYVALTRAKYQLHILTSIPETPKELNNISYVFDKFLRTHPSKEQDDPYIYNIGVRGNSTIPSQELDADIYQLHSIQSSPWRDKLRVSLGWKKVWHTSAEIAQEIGNKIHSVLSYVQYSDDIPRAMSMARSAGILKTEEISDIQILVERVVYNTDLSAYFDRSKYQGYNERELLCEDGRILRPDRLCIDAKKAIVIDYKTGEYNSKHIDQVRQYAQILSDMGYVVEKRILIYVDKKDIKLMYV